MICSVVPSRVRLVASLAYRQPHQTCLQGHRLGTQDTHRPLQEVQGAHPLEEVPYG